MTLPLPVWLDIVDTVEGADPWLPVTQYGRPYWVALWAAGVSWREVETVAVPF